MKIQSMHVENYRCFDKFDINFDDNLTVIVGINGSGKTAILEALVPVAKIYAKQFCNRYLSTNNTYYNIRDVDYFDFESISPSNLRKNNTKISFIYNFFQEKNDKESIFDKITINLSIEFNQEKENLQRLKLKDSRSKLEFFKKRGTVKYFSVVVYYSSKRILAQSAASNTSHSEKEYAYLNAFVPQIDFPESLAWFIDKASQEALEGKRRKDLEYTIPELSAVRQAVSQALLGNYDEPFVTDTPPTLFITPKGHPEELLQVEQLSDGYRTMLALVMDLARRMAVANQHIEWPEGKTVLHSPGIVLIDEVELHLHPSWQQSVLPTLMKIFPNVQFIVTTHSPQVLTSIAAKHIRILRDGKCLTLEEETEGAEANRLLEDVLGVKPRPQNNPFTQKLVQYTKLVYDEKWDTPEAEALQKELEDHYGDSEPALKELELHIENSKWERGL